MKTQHVLKLYDDLLSGKTILRREFCQELQITERTFYRYINEVYDFLKDKKSNLVIDVQEPFGRYILKIKD